MKTNKGKVKLLYTKSACRFENIEHLRMRDYSHFTQQIQELNENLEQTKLVLENLSTDHKDLIGSHHRLNGRY